MAKRVIDGKVYTPPKLALLAASKLYEYQDILRKRGAKEYGGRTVWDPCCGDGALLDACKRIDSVACCCGIDTDEEAVVTACKKEHICEHADLFSCRSFRRELLVCNPPYVGRRNIRRIIGDDRFKWLKSTYPAARSGSCDLAGYVLRHVLQMWRPVVSTWIVTNTIAQGATRRVGLQWALTNGYQIVSALKDIPWAGDAAVTVHVVTIVDAWRAGGYVAKEYCEYEPFYQF